MDEVGALVVEDLGVVEGLDGLVLGVAEGGVHRREQANHRGGRHLGGNEVDALPLPPGVVERWALSAGAGAAFSPEMRRRQDAAAAARARAPPRCARGVGRGLGSAGGRGRRPRSTVGRERPRRPRVIRRSLSSEARAMDRMPFSSVQARRGPLLRLSSTGRPSRLSPSPTTGRRPPNGPSHRPPLTGAPCAMHGPVRHHQPRQVGRGRASHESPPKDAAYAAYCRSIAAGRRSRP